MRALQAVAIAGLATAALGAGIVEEARRARDRQDRAALETAAARAAAAADKQPGSASAQHDAALTYSYVAEVATELRDAAAARQAAEAGVAAAEKAVALDPNSAEFRRLLGVLYGQLVPGNLARAVQYGRRSVEELDRALALAPNNSDVHLSRGIGKYYLPAILGGGAEAALEDLRKAIELDPKSDQAHLWLGLALRKANRLEEARQALARAVKLNPERLWAKQQLEKTPAR